MCVCVDGGWGEGEPEPPSIVRASWMRFALIRPHSDLHPTPHLRVKLALLALREQLVLAVPR